MLRRCVISPVMITPSLAFGLFIACVAIYTDLRSRKIPNWLTLPGLFAGLAVNLSVAGWHGLKASLLGAGLGLVALLPFVLLKSLGGGDWKLAGALGACLGPAVVWNVLLASVFVAGIMALGLIIWKGRLRQSLMNIAHILRSLLTGHMPGPQVSLENPEALKVPYGVALGLTVILYWIGRMRGLSA